VEQLDYEAACAFEQYNEVDPRNRLVASELERRWNEKLEELKKARTAVKELAERRRPVSEEQHESLLALGERFAPVWESPACPVELKKKIIRTVVEEVMVDEAPGSRLRFVVHWKGGTHTAFEMEKPRSPAGRKTVEEDLEIIRKMAVRYGDDQIARVLNKLGRRTGKGRAWSREGVKTARRNHAIPGHTRMAVDPEVLSLQGAARLLGVSDTTIRRLVEAGVLPMKQVVPWAPWEIPRAALDSPAVRRVVNSLKKTGRLDLKGDKSALQRTLFE
jgi:excisionase family DNA binding protein